MVREVISDLMGRGEASVTETIGEVGRSIVVARKTFRNSNISNNMALLNSLSSSRISSRTSMARSVAVIRTLHVVGGMTLLVFHMDRRET